MAHPLVWPKKAFYYLIGNTPPICLTQELSPDVNANILMLGCGDPRSILFTIFSDLAPDYRMLDISCCDWEPAVLARNVMLFSMAADGVPTSAAWSIFYEFFLEKESYDILLAQCRTLVQASSDMKTWKSSKYGNYIRFSSLHTLSEVRRHWTLYLEFENLSDADKKAARASFTSGMKAVRDQFAGGQVISGIRAAGPFFMSFMKTASISFDTFWYTGTTASDQRMVSPGLHTNPTFLYSLSGNVFNVHYGTDPLFAFHVAPGMISIKGQKSISNPTLKDFYDVAKNQFRLWCSAFQKRVSAGPDANLKLRFHVGESLAFCHALLHRQRKGVRNAGVYTAQWGGSQIVLDDEDYSQEKHSAPLSFDIIDTSNLTDHLGILNILCVTVPLLQTKPWATIHTNTLVAIDPNDPSTSTLAARAGVDIPTLSLLFGVTPSSCLSHFSTQSNKHELLATSIGSKQVHDALVWKRHTSITPASIPTQGLMPPDIQMWEVKELASVLFSFYLSMFENEGMVPLGSAAMTRFMSSARASYTREGLVILLALIKQRVDANWEEVMQAFLALVNSDRTLILGLNNYQDFICQLYQRDIYTMNSMKLSFLKTLPVPKDLFRGWKDIPPVVCVVLKVPRSSMKKLEEMEGDVIQTPFLQCETRGLPRGFEFTPFHNIHSSIRPIFGQILLSSNEGQTQVSIKEDVRGFNGDSPLIVTFYLPTWILLKHPADCVEVGLGFKNTPTSVVTLIPKLGYHLSIYTTRVSNSDNVFIVRHRPDNPHELEHLQPVPEPARTVENTVTVTVDTSGMKASSLTVRTDIRDTAAKRSLGSGASVTSKSVADATVNVKFEDYDNDLVFPFPIYGDRTKLRIARKSSYIEVEAPIRPNFEDSRILSLNPFPVAVAEENIHLLNVHYLNLDKLPTLALPKSEKTDSWLPTHMGLSFSDEERAAKELPDQKLRGVVPNLKESIYAFLGHHMSNPQRPRVFGLSITPGIGIYTLIFLNDIKLDLSAHTIVIDACAVPLYDGLMSRIAEGIWNIRPIQIITHADEALAWQMLLPAAAERCRTWKHTAHCEYLTKGVPAILAVDDEYDASPLCSCGKGKNLGAFGTVPEWKPFYRDATRVAISPLFTFCLQTRLLSTLRGSKGSSSVPSPVTSMASTSSSAPSSTTVPTSVTGKTCAHCGGPGHPALQTCSQCKKVQYCSQACQKSHWKAHKVSCTLK